MCSYKNSSLLEFIERASELKTSFKVQPKKQISINTTAKTDIFIFKSVTVLRTVAGGGRGEVERREEKQ